MSINEKTIEKIKDIDEQSAIIIEKELSRPLIKTCFFIQDLEEINNITFNL